MAIDVFVDYEHGEGDARIGVCTMVGARDEVRALVDELKNKGLINDAQVKPLTDRSAE